MYATGRQKAKYIQLLVKHGSHVDSVNKEGTAVLPDLMQYLHSVERGDTIGAGLRGSILPLPLQCICAQMLAPYKYTKTVTAMLPTQIRQFIHLH